MPKKLPHDVLKIRRAGANASIPYIGPKKKCDETKMECKEDCKTEECKKEETTKAEEPKQEAKTEETAKVEEAPKPKKKRRKKKD